MGEFLSKTVSNLRLHGYPDSRRSGSVVPFARNFATGPEQVTPIDTVGVAVPWDALDVGAPGTHVPITPLSTGVVRISAVLPLKSSFDTEDVGVGVAVLLNDVSLAKPAFEAVTVNPAGSEVMAVLAELTGLTVGVTYNVSIVLTANLQTESETVSLALESSSIELQEVPAATG